MVKDSDAPKEQEDSGLTVGQVARLISKAREAGWRQGVNDSAVGLGIEVDELMAIVVGSDKGRE